MKESKLVKSLKLSDLGIKGFDLQEKDYVLRNVVRGIILNNDKIAFVIINSTLLPGGGVENGETFEEALKRECLEELGIEIFVKESIGHVVNFKYIDENNDSKKYFVECYVCEFIRDLNTKEKEGELIWFSLSEGIKILGDQYNKLELNLENSSKLFNLKTHIIFLKEYRSLMIFKQKNFEVWTRDKKMLAEKTDNDLEDFYYREREVWWCSVGINIGYEQDGKGQEFLRPVLIVKKLNKFTFLGVPLSSILKEDKNRYKSVITLKNKKEIINDILINQIRIFDIRRIKYQLGTVKEVEFMKIKKSIQDILV